MRLGECGVIAWWGYSADWLPPAWGHVWGSISGSALKPRIDFRFEVSLSRGCPLRADNALSAAQTGRGVKRGRFHVPINRPIRRFAPYSIAIDRTHGSGTPRSRGHRAGIAAHPRFEWHFKWHLEWDLDP